MQWFVKEQVEEETFALDLIDEIVTASGKDPPKSAFQILNQKLMDEPDKAPSAEDATAETPV